MLARGMVQACRAGLSSGSDRRPPFCRRWRTLFPQPRLRPLDQRSAVDPSSPASRILHGGYPPDGEAFSAVSGPSAWRSSPGPRLVRWERGKVPVTVGNPQGVRVERAGPGGEQDGRSKIIHRSCQPKGVSGRPAHRQRSDLDSMAANGMPLAQFPESGPLPGGRRPLPEQKEDRLPTESSQWSKPAERK